MENLNAEQVKKALECCSSSDGVSACESGCPYWGGDYDTCPCIEEPNFIIKNALALINSQEQRIGELAKENERLTRLANLRQRDLDNANDLLFKAEDEICEGRMVELPCKVGDTVWEVWASGSDITQTQRGVRAIKVDLIYINQYDTIIHCISEEMAGHIPLSDFGKTVFLTPEEANKKLKELENEN